MGHPSSQALSKVSSNIELDTSKNKNISYDVCLRAKQSRVPFPLSNNIASKCFDLIHCDIWVLTRLRLFVGLDISLLLFMMLVEVFGLI